VASKQLQVFDVSVSHLAQLFGTSVSHPNDKNIYLLMTGSLDATLNLPVLL
jgi:hypothetical protein